MKWSGLVVALALTVGAAATNEAWADRGWRGDQFQSRHDAYKFRADDRYAQRKYSSRIRYEESRHKGRIIPVHRGGGRSYRGASVGLFIGAPLMWHWPQPYYHPYPPAVITVPAAPPTVYIERGYDDTPPAREQGYWHYCERPEGYYPYVRECLGGWLRVAPTPAR